MGEHLRTPFEQIGSERSRNVDVVMRDRDGVTPVQAVRRSRAYGVRKVSKYVDNL